MLPWLLFLAGQCLSYDNLRELITFAHEQKIVLMADEVYQENIYQDERPFVSARKASKAYGQSCTWNHSDVALLLLHSSDNSTQFNPIQSNVI